MIVAGCNTPILIIAQINGKEKGQNAPRGNCREKGIAEREKGQGAMPLAQVQGARSPLLGLGKAQPSISAFARQRRANSLAHSLGDRRRTGARQIGKGMQRMAAADSLLHAAYGCKWLPSAYSAYCFPRLRRGKDVMLRLGFAQTQQRLLASALSGGASPLPPFSRSAVPFSLQFARVRPFSLAFLLYIC